MALEQPTDDPTFWYGTNIQFVMTGRSPSGKTIVWLVQARRGGDHLGYVRWMSRWRKYSFYPEPNCVFEEVCLGDIAAFLTRKTAEHKGIKITLGEYIGG
jgi:hypothetical protein